MLRYAAATPLVTDVILKNIAIMFEGEDIQVLARQEAPHELLLHYVIYARPHYYVTRIATRRYSYICYVKAALLMKKAEEAERDADTGHMPRIALPLQHISYACR